MTILLSASVNLTVLGILCKENPTVFVFWWLASSTSLNILKIHLPYHTCQSFIFFQGWINYMFIHAWENLSCFHLLAIVNNASMSIKVMLLWIWLFNSGQSLNHVRLFATPWTVALPASLSITNSWSLPKLMSIELVMPSNYLILCCPLLLLPSIFPSIRVFSNKSALRIRWPRFWSFSFNISPSNEHSGLISFRMDWLDLLVVWGTPSIFSNTTVQKHQFFGTQLSLWSNSHIHT